MDSKPTTLHRPFSCSISGSPPREARTSGVHEGAITLQEWQGWGTASPVPAMVTKIVEDLKALEKDIDTQMSFGGSRGKLQVYRMTFDQIIMPYAFCMNIWSKFCFNMYLHFV